MLILKKKDDILCSKLSDILIKSLDYLNMYKMCCQDTVKIDDFEDQCIIFNLSKCVKLDPSDEMIENGLKLMYRSHIEMKTAFSQQSFFRFNNELFTQINNKI